MTVASPRHRELGLTDREYELIVEHMGRDPNEVELAVFSLMWSEHCAYKHSKPLLRTLPTEGARVVMGPGENAGAVSLGGGLACAFKVESHNHPSAVEPFQGAATGVGGILRDVFAVGARPIAILDSLRFGEVERSARSRYLLEQAVAGIGHYGNSIGVATVGGEIYFEDAYEQNCLVNAMCLGLIEEQDLIRSAAAGVGNVVLLFGARTGRDGIGGASVLASAELDELDAAKRPTVQIGDPFEEKKLLECSLELLDRGLLVALQDLGAAGLTSSSAEMASKGEVGIDIDVRKVPLREADMEAFEIMISESQERMLCVVEPDRVDEVVAVCEKWLVNATAVGEVTGSRRLRVFDDGALVGDMPVTALVDECPVYDLAPVAPSVSMYPAPEAVLASGLDAGGTLLALLRSANLASRRWAFEQYDCLVGSRTVRRPEQADAAVLGLELDPTLPPPNHPAIAVSIDGNGRRVACDPYRGAVEAVLECSANLACVGAEPLGLTNCLNFGNPEKPHVAWQLSRAVVRPRRRLPRALDPGRGRQRLALQRGGLGPDLPHAGGRPRRRAAQGGALGPARLRAGGRRGRRHLRRLVGARGHRLGAREAARRGAVGRAPGRPTSASCARCTPRSARPCAPARCAPPTTSRRAASPWRWPRRASPAASAPRSTCRRCGPAARRCCSVRARARSWSRARSSRCARSGRRRCGSAPWAVGRWSSTARWRSRSPSCRPRMPAAWRRCSTERAARQRRIEERVPGAVGTPLR